MTRKRDKHQSDKDELKRTFETLWRQLDGPELATEYYFAKPAHRQYRADYAAPEAAILLEIEGGIFTNGRHVRPMGYNEDCIKYNLAQQLGYRVFRFTRPMLETDPAGHLQPVIDLIRETEAAF